MLVQAIQARQVLRGTVGELVKETRKQEAEGVLLATPCSTTSHILDFKGITIAGC